MPTQPAPRARLWQQRETALFGAATLLLTAGVAAWAVATNAAATWAWAAATLLGLAHSSASLIDTIRAPTTERRRDRLASAGHRAGRLSPLTV